MSGGGGNIVSNIVDNALPALDETIRKTPDKFGRYADDLTKDPGRTGLAIATAGATEAWRETGKAGTQYLEDEAKRNMPSGVAAAPKAPTPDNKEAQREADAAAERERKRARSGYASTLLTGGQGVQGQANTARRRLMGT